MGAKKTWAALVVLLVACGRARGPSKTIPDGSPSFPDATKEEQAESAIVAAQDLLGNTRLVVAFNDYSSGPAGNPRLFYNAAYTQRTVAPGASLAGWSVSDSNSTNSFLYRGKISPPSGFAILWGDPSLAVDPTDRNSVYYAMMGVSSARWSEANGGLNPITTSPGSLMNSVCVGRSVSAGMNFENVYCAEVPSVDATAQVSIDQTSITVDSKGCLWLAFTDTTFNQQQWFVRVFRSRPATGTVCQGNDWKNLVEINPPQSVQTSRGEAVTGIFAGDIFPRLKFANAHEDGHPCVYIGTQNINTDESLFNGNASVSVREFDVADEIWSDAFFITPACIPPALPSPLSVGPSPNVTIGLAQSLRVGRPYDFDVGRTSAGAGKDDFAVRVAMQLFVNSQVPGGPDGFPIGPTNRFVQVHETSNSSACFTSPSWTTAFPIFRPGQAFQPVLHATGNTIRSQWWLGYLTTNFVPNSAADYIRTEAQVVGFANFAPSASPPQFLPGLFLPLNLDSPNSFACLRRGSTAANGYWGDYWDLTHIDTNGTPTVVGAFSHSLTTSTTCQVQTDFQAQPLSIGVSNWSISLGSNIQ